MEITRREFVKGTLGVAVSLTSLTVAPALGLIAGLPTSNSLTSDPPANEQSTVSSAINLASKVFSVRDYSCVDNDWRIDGSRVEHMVEAMLKGLTGASSVEEGWKIIIPELKPTSRIAIKVNCINPKLPSHPEVTLSLAKTLIRTGVMANNIIIWDRSEGNIIEGLIRCGYRINTSQEGIRCLAVSTNGVGFDSKNLLHVPSVKKSFPVTRIISEMADFIINVAVLKDHAISGITLSMKNFYGAIPLWNEFAVMDVRRMHQNRANPQIAELYNNALIKDKVRLNVCDALLACYDEGPRGRPQWAQYQLMASTDPVALDSLGLKIIDIKRQVAGLPPASARAGYIEAADRLGLGQSDLKKIEFNEIVLG